ncbi:hypothetical protein [Mycobacterium sp. MS1601]|uniref:hypothetical protein n=1 Tax=Mycobacterium sp. MS1601 TaxID=1936029 RepID=UPI0012FA0B1B|nr:hypothetical protein [Mycobacterium sp. MS1601]
MNDSALLITLLVLQSVLAGWLLWRNPYNPLSIVGVLTTVFSSLPAVLFLDGSGFESYSWRNFTILIDENSLNSALYLGTLNICLLLGAAAAEQFTKKESFILQEQKAAPVRLIGSPKIAAVSAIYFALWLALAAIQYRQSGQSLTRFLLPIQQTGVAAEQSGYLRSMYLAIPSVLVVLSYWKHGRMRLSGWVWVGLALMATFSTHQRRELVTTALLLLSLTIFLGPLRTASSAAGSLTKEHMNKIARRGRPLVLGVLTAGLLLVPLLWYARVYFTSWSQGESVNAFEVRSFQDVLFGSPSTGFPTFVYIQDFVDSYGAHPLYLLLYPFTIFIPRALWTSKPVDLDTILEEHYWLIENPSSFWYGELYYGFGPIAPIAALLLAFLFYRFCLKCQLVPDLWYRSLAAVFFMQSVTLFKNGVTVFIIETAILVVLLGIAWIVCRPPKAMPPPRTRPRVADAVV